MRIQLDRQFILNGLFLLSLLYAFLNLHFVRVIREPFHLFFICIIVYTFIYHRNLFKTPPFFFVVVALVIATITWILSTIQTPDIGSNSPRLGNMTEKIAFIPLAVLLATSTKRIFIFWTVAASAALLSPWIAGDGWAEIQAAYHGLRTGFGGHIITMGIIYATIAMALLIFARRVCAQPSHFEKLKQSLLLLVLLIGASFGIVASQTRSIYLGLLFIYLLTSFFILLLSLKSWHQYKKITIIFFTVSILCMTVIFFLHQIGLFDSVIYRATTEKSVLTLLLSGSFDQIPESSAGLRLHFWIEAYQWIAERPWTGWGIGANRALHIQAGNFFEPGTHFISVHNDLIETLLAYGVLGAAFFAVLIIWTLKSLYQAWKNKSLETDLFIFFVLFMVFFIINGFFMSLLNFNESLHLWNIVMAGAFGVILKDKYIKKRTSGNES